jgi:hypothetical protein
MRMGALHPPALTLGSFDRIVWLSFMNNCQRRWLQANRSP